MKGKKILIPMIFRIQRYQLSAAEKRLYYFMLLLAAAGSIVCIWGLSRLIGVLFEVISLPFQPHITSEKIGSLFQSLIIAISRFTIGGFVALGSGNFLPRLIFCSNQQNSNSEESFTPINTTTDNRIIETSGGNYNEFRDGNYNEFIAGNYIQGDYVNGDYINMSSDFSQALVQLQELIFQLQTEGFSQRDAQQKIEDDLVNQARNNPEIRQKLIRWRKSLGDDVIETSVTEAATEVVEFATTASKTSKTSSKTSSNDLSSEIGVDYRKLEKLLRTGKWKEADQETATIMLELFLGEEPLWLLSAESCYKAEHIKKFPGKDLNTINNLWVKYSKERFGFSVQQRIWKQVQGDCDAFGERVGWRVGGRWIYRSDINFSLNAPLGHLPAKVIIGDQFEPYDYGDEVLEVLAHRVYRL